MRLRKKILIIDYRPEGHRGYESFPSVEFHTRYPKISERDPEEIATVFVHEGNHPEKSWTERHFHEPEDNQRLFYFFSSSWDGKPAPEPLGPGYKIGRQRFLQYISKFLTHYEETGELWTQFFKGEEPSPKTLAAPQEDILSRIPRLIFVDSQDNTETHPGNTQAASITRKASGDIDFYKTLQPLANLPAEPVRLLHIKEKYLQPFDGIELAWYIRISAFLGSFSRFPIYLELESGVSIILKASPRLAQLLFDADTFLLVPSSGYRPASLAPQSHEAFLQQIAVPIPDEMTIHDLANEWGALRFLDGYNKLTNGSNSTVAQRAVLLEREYYWVLLSRAHYAQNYNSASMANNAAEWLDFLNSLNTNQEILLIDDHAEKGWSDALKSIFIRAGSAHSTSLEYYPQGNTFDATEAEALAVNRSWNLILCDLRLTESDKQNGRLSARGGPTPSGIQLISNIKRVRPNTPLIAFTASEKAWNYDAALNAGADACWIKEGPGIGINDNYTVHNVVQLLNCISHVITKKQLSTKLWNCYAQIEGAIKNPAYLAQWPALPSGTSNLAALQHLKDIAERLRRAYGYLESEPSDYYQQEFEHNPRDLAFLMVWSCINEIVSLYFAYDKAAPGDYHYLVRSPGSAWHWHKYGWSRTGSPNRSDFDIAFKALGREDTTQSRKAINFEKMYSGGNRGKIFGTEHIQILLRSENQTVLENNFVRLRDLRNYLDMEHGDISSRRHAVQQDIDEMADLVDHFTK